MTIKEFLERIGYFLLFLLITSPLGGIGFLFAGLPWQALGCFALFFFSTLFFILIALIYEEVVKPKNQDD